MEYVGKNRTCVSESKAPFFGASIASPGTDCRCVCPGHELSERSTGGSGGRVADDGTIIAIILIEWDDKIVIE